MTQINLCDSQGNGLEAGLELKFPYVESEVEAIACKKPYEFVGQAWMALTMGLALGGGACDTGDPYQGAVKLTPQAGIEATFTAGKIKGDKDVDITLGVRIPPSMLDIPDPLIES